MNTNTDAFRTETDSLGEKQLPSSAYYGIHTARALENFAVSSKKVHPALIRGIVLIKKGAALAHEKLGELPSAITQPIIQTCDEILSGRLMDQFMTDAFQGGAGTSTHMNVNEVIANRAIEILGGEKGDYGLIHPLHHVNRSQSTNDVYPTALRIAAISLLRPLSRRFASLQEALQEKEHGFSDMIKLGRTQLMDALPMMVGQSFGAFAQAVSRDRWRLYKVEERLRQINIGGTAIGTGMNATLKYIYQITDLLQELTGFGLARSEFPMDPTQNMDVFVEVSGLLKAAAVNLIKIANDIRLLSSGPKGGFSELKLMPVQAGSSIMPGKVNPVIPEMVVQVGMRVIANDAAITQAAMGGQLELNAFSPLIAESLLESMELLTNAVTIFEEKCIRPLEVDEARCKENLLSSTSLVTALVHHIGYEAAAEIAKEALEQNRTIQAIALEKNILSKEELDKYLNPYQITKPGIPGIF